MYLDFYVHNPLVERNSFRGMPVRNEQLPTFEEGRALLPQPLWKGHEDALGCYWKVWEIAFRNLCQPVENSGFIANFIDTAFNGCLFMWDSAFILLFARYGRRAFNFQQTLDNFYAKQHEDGFICREIIESSGADQFHRFDPVSTGPNILPWTEWEYFQQSGDRERLAKVFPPLLAYHHWLRLFRTWRDGTYWASGLACGMDNQPRMDTHKYNPGLTHGHLIWADTCFQQIFAAKILVKMAEVLGCQQDVADLPAEIENLTQAVNTRLWDEQSAFYYDLQSDDTFSPAKSIGAYWALLADVVPGDRLQPFLAHLNKENEFLRPHRVPSMAADHPEYQANGGYWRGGVWAPTNYMLLAGLTRCGEDALAHEIACNHLENVVEVFKQTGTVWENYSPETAAPGKPAKHDFVGWTGLPPVAVLFEYVFGLRPDVPNRKLLWDVRLLDEHGVSQYPFGTEGLLDLRCGRRTSQDEKPSLDIRANIPLTLEVRWQGGKEVRTIR
ncbi:MAG TPA: trehalase family glycosidase [Anaerolineaceae bacterium]